MDALNNSKKAVGKKPLYKNATVVRPDVYQPPIKTETELSVKELERLTESSPSRETREGLPRPNRDSEVEYWETQASPVTT